jgi:hypothetical protein
MGNARRTEGKMSGFDRKTEDVWSLQICQPAKHQRCGNLKFRSCYFSNLTLLDDRRDQIRCPETSLNNYHTTPNNIPEERRSSEHRGESLKPEENLYVYSNNEIVLVYAL